MKVSNRVLDWALGILDGRTISPPSPDEGLVSSFEEASYQGPPRRTKAALISYLQNRNRYRYDRLKKDFEWAKKELERINFNPEDARFLL